MTREGEDWLSVVVGLEGHGIEWELKNSKVYTLASRMMKGMKVGAQTVVQSGRCRGWGGGGGQDHV